MEVKYIIQKGLIEERYTKSDDLSQIKDFVSTSRAKGLLNKHKRKEEDIILYVRVYGEIGFKRKGSLRGEYFYFEDGSSFGKEYLYSGAKLILETPFVNGVIEGIEKQYTEAGYLYRTTKYKKGKFNGREREYSLVDNQLRVLFEKDYKDDMLIQEKSYNPLSGELLSSIKY